MQNVVNVVKELYGETKTPVAVVDNVLNVLWNNNALNLIFPNLICNNNLKALMPSIYWIQAEVLLKKGESVYLNGKSEMGTEMSIYITPFFQDDNFKSAVCNFSTRFKAGDLATHAIAHDLKNPIINSLRALQLFSNEMMTTRQREYLKIIENSCNNLLSLATDLVMITDENVQKTTHIQCVVDLDKFLSDIIRQYRITAKEFIINFKNSSNYQHIYCCFDNRKIENALLNLLSNATKYCKSTIDVELGKTQDNYAVVTVSDDGDGVNSMIRNTLFEPCVKANSTGSGIGLYTASLAAKQNGGCIKLVDKNSFELFLPICNTSDVRCQSESEHNNLLVDYYAHKSIVERENI